MNRTHYYFFVILALFLVSCQPNEKQEQNAENVEQTVSFLGRSIDLQPYVEGFPYSRFTPSYEANKLFYMKSGETTQLLALDLIGQPALNQGKSISNIDYSKRNVGAMTYNKVDGKLYWRGDEVNDEIFNIYRLNIETGEIEKLTDVPYIFGWHMNEAKDKIAYVARLGNKEARLGELRILDLTTGEEETIIQDTPEMRFTWGSPSWQPEGKGVVLNAVQNADRTYGNLVYVDLEKKTQRTLLKQDQPRYFPTAYSDWLDENKLLYFSNEGGFRNGYTFDIGNNQNTQLTNFEVDFGDEQIIEKDGTQYLFGTTSNPIKTTLYLLDLVSGEVKLQQDSEVNLGVLDEKDGKMMVSTTSNKSMFRMDELEVSLQDDGFAFTPIVDVSETLKDQLYQSTVERISFPTFDIDEKTGEQRMLHAYLYKPKNPLPKEQQTVMIQSFYGGGNNFSMRYQILAEAGIYVLSPSPRGSSGFGREFFALNDKDLGGNEIIDVFYAAKYISEKLDIDPSRIGVFGGSHGGYATMRTLTFPGEINGNTAEFDWGFGISHAGFSDIIHFYENCNIPDWVTLEAGDPKTEADKLRDRSPLYHADKMKGKLLLTHGTNDSRVPIAGSRMMADSLSKYKKDYKLVEFEGQGHGIKGLQNTVTMYKTWFEFLEGVVAPKEAVAMN
ncbi:MAG: prolyl oligopeptidase family serine peptidase [Bacteroidota bacterium]